MRAIYGAVSLRTHFQPIVGLENGEITGYEALTRGPAGELESPGALFARAAAEGLLPELDRACLAAALANARDLLADPRPLLFLNVRVESLLDPTFLGTVEGACERATLPASRIVLEISGRTSVDDFPRLARRVARLRKRGFRVAIGAVGAGDALLRMFVDTDPDFVKLDRSLVRGVDQDRRRRSLLEAVALVARREGLTAVAEGIETEGELFTSRGLGIQWGQGFFLGRPAEGPTGVEPAAALVLRRPHPRVAGTGEDLRLAGAPTVGLLVSVPPTASRSLPVREALEVLESHRAEVLVVLEAERPWGVVRRGRLLEMLSRPFGRELHLRKPLEAVAETELLVVDAEAGLDQVSKLTAEGPEDALYSHVVVVGGGRFRGVVPVRRLLEAIADFRVETARYANPLTGLPGNHTIEAVIRSRLRTGGAVGVLHADLDRFKAFNDRYGFHRGDEAIRFTAQLLADVLTREGGEETFLGHVGGDDFIVVVAGERVVPIAAAIRTEFRERVGSLYPDVDRARGYILSRSRSGAERRFPLMDITVASTVITGAGESHFAQVLDTLAEAKRTAKARSERGRSAGG